MACPSRYGAGCSAACPLGNSRGAVPFVNRVPCVTPAGVLRTFVTLPTVATVGYVVASLRDSRRHESLLAILEWRSLKSEEASPSRAFRDGEASTRPSALAAVVGHGVACPAWAAQLVVLPNTTESLRVAEVALTASYPDDILNVNETGLPGL